MASSGRTRTASKKKPAKSKEKGKMLTTSEEVDKSLKEKIPVCILRWYLNLANQVVSIQSCWKKSLLII